MYSRILNMAATLACVVALYGCASNVNPVTGKTIYTPVSSGTEAYYGGKANKELIASHGVYAEDAALSAYVDRVGQAVAKGVVRKSVKYTFTILNDDEINAYALPGGYVYVTRGALNFANNEAELAGILGHEIGHIDAFHFGQRRHDTVAALLSILLRNSSSGVKDLELAQKLADDSAETAAYSQDQEYEADALSMHYLSLAGYDPQSMVNVMRTDDAKARLDDGKMKGNAVAHNIYSMDKTHPTTPDRVARAAEAAKIPVVNPKTDRESYLAAIEGMAFGPDPNDGVVEGRRIVHPALGFSFSAPDGFDLWNTHIGAFGVSSKAVLVLEAGTATPGQSMESYLKTDLSEDMRVDNLHQVDLDGYQGATGVIFTDPFIIRVGALRDRANHLYQVAYVAPRRAFYDLDGGFLDSLNSFRPLATTETAPTPKLRLHVITVGAGDTVESLAAQMAVKDKKLEWFRVLNGLSATEAVAPGQRVKVVVVGE